MATQEAIKNLNRWEVKFPQLLVEAVNQTMLTVMAEAKRTRAFQNQTGRLRASILGGLVSIEGHQIVGALTAGAEDANAGRAGWETPSMKYAPHVELGTSRRAPHPFIWPAMQTMRNKRILERQCKMAFAKSQP